MRCLFGLFLVLLGGGRIFAAIVAEIPFDFRDGLLWLEVTSDKSAEPLTFLLDSGATVSVIDSRAAERLKIERGNRVEVRGVRSSVAGYWPARFDATVGSVSLPKKYLVTDLSALSKSCHSSIDGLLGADFFASHIVQIDFSTSRIRLLSAAEPSARTEVLPLRTKTGRVQVPLRVNDSERKWVRIDTGCTSQLQWVSKKQLAPSLWTTRSVGLSKCSFPTTTTDVRINEIVFENVITGVHSSAIFPGEYGLLGTGLLSRFQKLTFDTQSGRLLLDN